MELGWSIFRQIWLSAVLKNTFSLSSIVIFSTSGIEDRFVVLSFDVSFEVLASSVELDEFVLFSSTTSPEIELLEEEVESLEADSLEADSLEVILFKAIESLEIESLEEVESLAVESLVIVSLEKEESLEEVESLIEVESLEIVLL